MDVNSDEDIYNNHEIETNIPKNYNTEYLILNQPLNMSTSTSISSPEHSTVSSNEIVGSFEDIFDVLKKWNLEQLFTTLKEQKIDIDALKFMQLHHINQLLSSHELGTKIKFEYHLRKYQREQGMVIEHNTCIGCVSPSTDSTNKFISLNQHDSILNGPSSSHKTVILQETLDSTFEGKYILKLAYENRPLSDPNRTILINLIVNYFIQNQIRMGVHDCEKMSKQIVEYFPNEDEGIYFQRRKNQKPKGQLYDKYNNYIAKLRGNSFLPKSIRFKGDNNLAAVDVSSSSELLEPNGEEIQKDLKYNRDDSNIDIVLKKWQESQNYRRHTILQNKSNNIDQILEEWPAYTQSYGPRLIEIDFINIFPGSGNLYLNFDTFGKNIITIMDERICDAACKKLLKEFKQQKNISIDAKNYIILFLLHGLLRPSNKRYVINEFRKKVQQKYTIKDSQDSFMVFASTVYESDRIIQEKKQICILENRCLQPFIFAIGDNEFSLSSFYIYFDGIKYKAPSIIAALDNVFKLFHVFNIKYPIESETVWLFIQKFFYKIETAYDQVFPSVNLLITKLSK